MHVHAISLSAESVRDSVHMGYNNVIMIQNLHSTTGFTWDLWITLAFFTLLCIFAILFWKYPQGICGN
jgi:hypothetical protein